MGSTAWSKDLRVTADGTGVVSHVGAPVVNPGVRCLVGSGRGRRPGGLKPVGMRRRRGRRGPGSRRVLRLSSYRRLLRASGITPRIARRGAAHGSGLGKVRWVVERGFAWLHALKRLRTRYERRADTHLGLLRLACALICHRQLEQSFLK